MLGKAVILTIGLLLLSASWSLAGLGPLEAGERPPLEVRINLVAQRELGPGGKFVEVPIAEGGALRTNDWFQVHFQTNADAYVYIILFEVRGRAQLLFPVDSTGPTQKARGQITHVIPAPYQWFFLDDRLGTEIVYLLASYEPIQELDRLLSELGSLGKGQVVPAEGKARGIGVVPAEGKGQMAISLIEGRIIQTATEIVRRYAFLVRRISYRHVANPD